MATLTLQMKLLAARWLLISPRYDRLERFLQAFTQDSSTTSFDKRPGDIGVNLEGMEIEFNEIKFDATMAKKGG